MQSVSFIENQIYLYIKIKITYTTIITIKKQYPFVQKDMIAV